MQIKNIRLNSILVLSALSLMLFSCKQPVIDRFPDGTPIPEWFFDDQKIALEELGEQFVITAHGVESDSSIIQTEALQQVIDKASISGGVVVIPEGTFLTGALFFKPGTHLHLAQGARLKGSNDISNFPLQDSRMEGQNLAYFPAVINAYGVDGFSMTGNGTIDGDGTEYYKAFWKRRKENPKCTNLEVSRPRLVFIWDCDDVQIQDVDLRNSGFWTTHLYQCNNIKILDVNIFAPRKPIPGPSTDAIDLDVCTNVLIKGCSITVNDDAIALKGGKGPYADEDKNNGPNFNILIEDCAFGWCHSVLTCGSESIHDRNVLLRNSTVEGASRLMFMKMRPDTPQTYEYITIDNMTGSVGRLVYVRPWTQFYDLQGRETPPVSVTQNVTLSNLTMECDNFASTGKTEFDVLRNFTFRNLDITAEKNDFDTSIFEGLTFENVLINGASYN